MNTQRSPEWYQERAGKVTASRLKDVMATTKSGYSATRKNYMMELLCQRLSGNVEEGFTSTAMQRGIDREPIARGGYEADKGVMVDETGFALHPSINGFGASPDGLVGDDGLVEIKCPNTATHVEFLKTGKPKREYILQMHGQMMCTGRAWCDFVSYDDRLLGLEYRCVRVEFDEDLGNEICAEVGLFLAQLDDEIKAIEKLKEAA
jgi:putative phage-type endonuclease